MKVLYVEDNPANVFLVKRVARMGSHEIINYIDGNQALQKFDEISPDLVLMDIQLAGDKTGLDVVKALRARGVTTPIIAVTAYAMVGDRERCIDAGCDDYLAKPLPIPRLVEMFKQYSEAAAKAKPTVAEAKVEPVIETPAEPVTEAKVEPAVEAKSEPVVEAPAEPVAELKTEPASQTPAEPATEAKVEPVVEAKSEPTAMITETPGTISSEQSETQAPKSDTTAEGAEKVVQAQTDLESSTTIDDQNTINASDDKSTQEVTVSGTSEETSAKESVTSSSTQADISEKIDSAEEVATGE